MAQVRILSEIAVNQIAAGEVVERPASVVKELVENSLDAGSTEINVVVAAGGKSSIEVIDNGEGLTRADALLAIERYGTSKISDAKDLLGVSTLGFRGEALPSIASVSRFTLASRTAESSQGVEIRIDGGKLRDVSDVGMAQGTSISVRNLFYNVPARKKFLRADRTELGQVKTVFSDLALAFPKVRFELSSEGKSILLYPAVTSLKERAAQAGLSGTNFVSFEESFESIVDAETKETSVLKIKGSICQPADAVSAASRLRLLVNNRCVRDKVLLRAVRDGYGMFLKQGKYPIGIVSIELSSADVDVNVHPQKTEVRFRAPGEIFRRVTQSVHKALAQSPSVSGRSLAAASLSVNSTENFSGELASTSSDFKNRSLFDSPSASVQGTASGFGGNVSPDQIRFFDSSTSLAREYAKLEVVDSALSAVETVEVPQSNKTWGQTPLVAVPQTARYLGQLFKLYLLFESGEDFFLVDMHAAHERVRFFELKRDFLNANSTSQELLIPEVVEVPADRVGVMEDAVEVMQRFGFEIEVFGESSLLVRSVPSVFGALQVAAMLKDLFSLPEFLSWSKELDTRLDEVLARLACHSSIRRGRELEREEAYALLEVLEQAEVSGFCPHGRPIVKRFKQNDIESMFDRV